MAARATVTYTAEISDLRKQLASIPDITGAEARKAVANLNKAVKGVERAQKRAAKAAEGQAASVKGLGDVAGDSESAMRSWTGLVGLASPKAEAMFNIVAEGAGAFEGLSKGVRLAGGSMSTLLAVAAPLAVAAGAVALAFADAKRESDSITSSMELQASVGDALEVTERRLEDASLARAHALGELSKAQLRQAQAQITAQRAVLDFAEAQKEQKKELNEARESAEGWLDFFDRFDYSIGNVTTRAADAIFGWSDTVEDAGGKLQTLNEGVVKEVELQKELKRALEETAEAQDRSANSKRRSAQASKEQAEAEKAHAEAAKEAQALLAEEREKIAQREQEARTAEHEAMKAETARILEQAELEKEARRGVTDMTLASVGVMSSALEGAFNEGSAAAQTFYVVSQGIAAAGAIISGLQASVAALLPPPIGLGPTFGPPLATATAAFGYAQAGAIAAQTVASFADTPGPVRAGGHGMAATFAPGDTVIAGRDTRDIQRQLNGAGGSSGPVVVERDVYRHLGRYGARDALRAPKAYEQVRRQARRTPGRR
jgi:hypothetical protein